MSLLFFHRSILSKNTGQIIVVPVFPRVYKRKVANIYFLLNLTKGRSCIAPISIEENPAYLYSIRRDIITG